MTKADIVFGLSTIASVWNVVQQQVHPLVSERTFSILGVAFMAISVIAYALYEKINGTTPPPTPPQS